MSQTQRILIIITGVIIVIALILGISFWASSPTRAAHKIEKALQKQDKDAIAAMIPSWVGEADRDDIQFFLDDWAEAGVPTVSIEEIDAWRSRPSEQDANKQESVPTPRYWAHNADISMVVSFEDFEDPVVVTLTRKNPNTWSIFAQIFRGWELTAISYQTDGEETEDGDDFEVIEKEATNTNTVVNSVNQNTNTATNTKEEAEEETTSEEGEEIILEDSEETSTDDETSNANGEAEEADEEDSTEDGEVEIFDAGLIEQ